MQKNGENFTHILSWEQLKQKKRNEIEELLLQSVRRLEPAYWEGVKLLEDCLYGAFCFHESGEAKRRVVSAAFLLNEKEFLMVILRDEKKALPSPPLSDGGMEEKLEAVFEKILKQGQQRTEEMEKYLIDMEQEIEIGRASCRERVSS